MKTFYLIIPLLFLALLSACAAEPAAPGAQPTSKPAVFATTAPDAKATAAPTLRANLATATAPIPNLKPAQLPAATAFSPIQLTLGGQAIQINAQEMMTVSAADFVLTGQALPGTVVSIDNDFILIDGSQRFSFTIKLEEGPNLVEIVASNAREEQASLELVIVYDPTS